MTLCGFEIAPGEKRQVKLPVPGGAPLEAWLLCGAHPGKTLVVTAGVHGCEYVGILALQKLAETLDCATLFGQVILLPLVNSKGFFAGVKQLNPADGRNLNREFPGKADGTETQRMAWTIEKLLYPEADFLLDLHGGDWNEELAPLVFFPGKPIEYTFFRPQQYGEKYIIKEWPSFNAMLEGYYAEKDRAERLRTKSKELHKAVHNMYERAVRKQAARQEELAASGKSEKLRLYGELLSANLYLAQKGMKSITVPNWYDEGKEVTIPLDLRFTPSQNAQNFFKNYKKKQTAARMLVNLLAEGEKEIAYLETVLYEVESASGEAALNEIRAELKSQGYLKYYKQRDKRQKPADFLRFTSTDGFEILVGRNNAQNDKLTLHTARGKDLWFHVQKAPGSHVVVMSRGEEIPDTTKQEAAQLAVIYSSTYKAGTGAKVAVDTTEVKNIWKASGAKPGMVLYEVYTTVYITPRDGLAEQLKKK